jgi:hypothetical protein
MAVQAAREIQCAVNTKSPAATIVFAAIDADAQRNAIREDLPQILPRFPLYAASSVHTLISTRGGNDMGNRFRFEPQSTLQKLAIGIRHPSRWREKTATWVFDREGGTRFQLARDEDELVRRLAQAAGDCSTLETT